jgi:hypothetical protein
MKNRITLFVLGVCLTAAVSCGSGELPIRGTVLVDGAPMDSGTLRFDPIGDESPKGVGGSVENGVLQLPAGHGLNPGKYRVSATVFKKTGRTINDYQRGAVEEMHPLALKDSPQEIELTHDIASNLTIEFTTAARP